MNQKCIKCGASKPLDQFHRHPQMALGHIRACKVCTRAYGRAAYKAKRKNPDWLKKERERCRIKQANYRKIGLAKQTSNAVKLAWASRNKPKRIAQSRAERALKRGMIKRKRRCEHCRNKRTDLEMHHPDYSKPMLVEWVCPPCHGKTRRKQ